MSEKPLNNRYLSRARPVKPSSQAWAKFVIPIVFIAIFQFVNPALASTLVSGEREKIEKSYRQCLGNSELELSSLEQQKVQYFRQALEVFFQKDRQRLGQAAEIDYTERLRNQLNLYNAEAANPKYFIRIVAAVAEERLKREAALSIGYSNKAFRQFMGLVDDVIFRQKATQWWGIYSIEPETIDQQGKDLIDEFRHHYMRKVDRAVGVRTPTSLVPGEPERMASIASTVSQLIDVSLQVLLENQSIRKNQLRYQKTLALQAAAGVAGFGVLVFSAIYFQPFVAYLGSVALRNGLAKLVGQMAGGAMLGGFGAGSAEVAVRALVGVIIDAWNASWELRTPFICELQKNAALSELIAVFTDGAVFGVAFGVGYTGITAMVNHIVMGIVTGTGVGVSFSYESFQAYRATRKSNGYQEVLAKVETLKPVPDELREEHVALVRILRREIRLSATKSSKHIATLGVVGIEAYALWPQRELYHALKDGREAMTALSAFSSDVLPSVGKSVVATAGELRTIGKPGDPLMARVRLFLETHSRIVARSGAMVLPTVLREEYIDWDFKY